HLVRLRVAEELRHADEQVAIEPVELLAILAQAPDVLLDVRRFGEREPALDATRHRAGLVMSEIEPELVEQHLVNGADARRSLAARFDRRQTVLGGVARE